jgi:hypothetical protein
VLYEALTMTSLTTTWTADSTGGYDSSKPEGVGIEGDGRRYREGLGVQVRIRAIRSQLT